MNEVAAMDCNLRIVNNIGLYTSLDSSVFDATLHMARIDYAESK